MARRGIASDLRGASPLAPVLASALPPPPCATNDLNPLAPLLAAALR